MPTTRSQAREKNKRPPIDRVGATTKQPRREGRTKASSAVEGMEIGDCRRYLNSIRKMVEEDHRPLDINQPLPGFRLSIQDFCYQFILGSYKLKNKKK